MTAKKIIGKVHLYLGLASGIVVFVVAITGCILAFQREIEDSTQAYRYVTPGGKPLAPSVLKAKAEAVINGKKANGVLYNMANRSAEVGFYNPDPEYYYVVYMNPYTGAVQKIWDEDTDFFHWILHGHYYLWLPEKVGQPIVATATLVFMFLLISGLVLWWPKNKNASKQRFSIKWNAAWRRKNYDLHNVLGFYTMIFGLLFAVTGLVWGFQWFSQSLYTATGGKGSDAYVIPPSDTTTYLPQNASIADQVWVKLNQQYPNHQGIYLSIPLDKVSSIFSYVNFRAGTYYKVDYHYFDQYTGKEVPAEGPYTGSYADANFAKKLRRMNYDIHVGAIWGLPGKIIACIASLIIASLPVTGVVIWWGRRKKPQKESRRKPRKVLAQ
ncbi:MAG: PepSY-associated TM helix domain-containing protein [Siphonobacter sp.]